MKVVKVSEVGFEEAVEKAVKTLIGGGIVVYPTETCYGLAAAIDDVEAVRRVYLVKRRPFSRPLTILVASIDMWYEYAYLTDEAMKLIKRFLPGPLTIVLWKKATVPDIVNPVRIGARISSHTLAQAMVKRLGKPVTATSANIHGDKEPYSITDVVRDVDLILDFGELPRKPPSTIVDLTVKPPVIQRTYPHGSFTEEEILRAISEG